MSAGAVAIVIVRVLVAMVIAVIVPVAAAPVVIVRVVMRMVVMVVVVLRTDQDARDLALDLCRLLARRALVLDRHRHDLRSDHDVVRPAEVVPAQAPGLRCMSAA